MLAGNHKGCSTAELVVATLILSISILAWLSLLLQGEHIKSKSAQAHKLCQASLAQETLTNCTQKPLSQGSTLVSCLSKGKVCSNELVYLQESSPYALK